LIRSCSGSLLPPNELRHTSSDGLQTIGEPWLVGVLALPAAVPEVFLHELVDDAMLEVAGLVDTRGLLEGTPPELEETRRVGKPRGTANMFELTRGPRNTATPNSTQSLRTRMEAMDTGGTGGQAKGRRVEKSSKRRPPRVPS